MNSVTPRPAQDEPAPQGAGPSGVAASASARGFSRGGGASVASPAPSSGGASVASSAPSSGGASRAGGRILQVIVGFVLGVLSGFILIGTHRMHSMISGVDIPWGLAFGFVYQALATAGLAGLFLRKLPVVALAGGFFCIAMTLATTTAAGSVLVPGEIAGEVQWQGWIIQLIGVGVPLIGAAVVWAMQIRRLSASRSV